jgi:integrase
MPQAAKGARLYLRKRAKREPTWVIRDKGKEIATGCDEGDREQAEKALADYIARKYESPSGPCSPDQMSIARALEIYGREHAPHVAAPRIIGFAIDALLPFWGDLPVSAIKGETCRAYVRHRAKAPATCARELRVLSAAINYCMKEGYLTTVPRVTLPVTPKGKTRWLTRNEAARLLWAARHVPHLRTFILLGLYTGTRGAAILSLAWMPNTFGGWLDLERSVLHRGAEGRVETNKRQPPCPLPAKLIAHLRRARKQTRQFVVEYGGSQVKKLRRSWRSACAAAGLGTDVTPHTLRHTTVTWLLLHGQTIWDVAHYVGMSPELVRERYGHHSPDFLKNVRDAL